MRRLFTCLLCALLPLGAAAAQRQALFLTLEYPPYTGTQIKDGGAALVLLREALATQGYIANFRILPWARVPTELRKPGVDGALPLWPEEVPQFRLRSSSPIFISKLGFFVRAGSPAPDTRPSMMRGKVVGVVRGYGYPPELAASGARLEPAHDDETNLKKLAAKRFDYVALERAVGEYLLANGKFGQTGRLVWQEPPFATVPLSIGVKNPELLAAIEQGMVVLRKNGRLAAIAREYNVDLPVAPAR